MHLFAPEVGLMGTSGIVGPCILQAAGAGYSFKLLKTDRVAVAFFGDGAVNNGAFHEGLNLASIWKLPVLFVCENNQFATEVPFAYAAGNPSVASRGGLLTACPASRSTATTCWPSTKRPARRFAVRGSGEGPTLLECKTYRTRPHAEGMGDFTYRTREEVEAWKTRCPILRFSRALLIEDDRQRRRPDLSAIEAEIDASVADAARVRRGQPLARSGDGDPTRLRRVEPARGHDRVAPDRPAERTREITFMQATLEAPGRGDGPQSRRSSCWAKASASAAATSRPRPGCYDLYGPERLCDTPICERGFVGLGCGAAMTGTRPVVDFMFADFVLDAVGRDHQPDRQDAVHEQRPAEDADPAARLHRHRPFGGHAPFGQLLPDVRPLPGPARRRPVDALRRQGPA